MKKIFTLIVGLLAMNATQAEEKTVWEGSEAISWNTEVAPGSQFETPEGTFSGLAIGNTIRIYTTTTYEEPQYVVTYKKGDSWEWTDLETTFASGIISFTIADEQTATEIADRGLILRGQAWTAIKITLDAETPQPIEGEQTVWEGTEPISWNTEVAPGTQYETVEGIFTGLEKGNVVRAYTTTTYDDPQYVITYKKGDSWEWIDLATIVNDGVITFTVTDDQMAAEISERGLVFRGQAYTLTKITITKDNTTGIRTIFNSRNNNVVYNILGQKVKGQHGLVIKNGKKYIIR
jgi:hypothetical protein